MDIIIHYIRIFVINMCVYYCFRKVINNKEKRFKDILIIACVNIILLFIYIPIRKYTNTFIVFAMLYFIYAIILAKITKNKLGFSMVITLVSYAIALISNTLSVFLQFIPYKIVYKLFDIESSYLNLSIMIFIQLGLIYGFFKIPRFKNGFSFFNKTLNNDIADIITINISSLIVIIYCMFGTYYEQIKINLAIAFIILSTIMFLTVKKMLTMYYKQKLLLDTMEEYKKEISDKQAEIDKLKADKKNVSRITHEFYNRQHALELLVASNMNSDNIDEENVNPNVLKIIESLTSEYSNRFESLKELPKLESCEILEIDNMFKYMQTECDKNNIEFKLKVTGNIHFLVNNIIAKNKLETLIGDHLRDAINAVNLSENDNKEILAVLGVKNKKYELSIFDNGIDFEINTLLKLGLEAVTTNAERGGTGTGFMTTFETMRETKASLIITEFPVDSKRHYTKCVTIRFDGKNQYRICSHRAKEIKQNLTDKRIKVEEYTKVNN